MAFKFNIHKSWIGGRKILGSPENIPGIIAISSVQIVQNSAFSTPHWKCQSRIPISFWLGKFFSGKKPNPGIPRTPCPSPFKVIYFTVTSECGQMDGLRGVLLRLKLGNQRRFTPFYFFALNWLDVACCSMGWGWKTQLCLILAKLGVTLYHKSKSRTLNIKIYSTDVHIWDRREKC